MAEKASWSEDEVVALLRRVSLFDELPDGDLQAIAGIVKPMKADAGHLLFREGEEGETFYIVRKGSVEIVKQLPGAKDRRLAVRRSGDAFGEMALLNDSPRSATARVLEPSELLAVDRPAFEQLMGGDSPAFRMMKSLSRALRALGVRFAAQERTSAATPQAAEMSRLLQRGILPRNGPVAPGYEVAAGTGLAEDGRGATIWDAFELADGRVALVVLTVPDDGLPPAHHLALARLLLRENARTSGDADVGSLLAKVSRGLAEAGVDGLGQHVHGFVLVLGGDGVEWAGAGVSLAAVLRGDGGMDMLDGPGSPLGMMEGAHYETGMTKLAVGDRVLVLSAGSSGLFQGAVDLVKSRADRPAAHVVDTLIDALIRAGADTSEEASVLLVRKA